MLEPRDTSIAQADAETDGVRVFELIPGTDFLVLFAGVDTPDEDVLEELADQADQRCAPGTLGAGLATLETFAQWAASGILGNAAWVPFPATIAYLKHHRSRKDVPQPVTVTPESVAVQAVSVCLSQAASTNPGNVHASKGGWTVTVLHDGRSVMVHGEDQMQIVTVTVTDSAP
jgi:hypothetical protein